MLYCGSGMAEPFMRAAAEAGPEAYAGYTGSFSSVQGASPLTWIATALGGLRHIGLAIMAALAVGLALQNRASIVKGTVKAAGKRVNAARAKTDK
jgi:hypothetical protein